MTEAHLIPESWTVPVAAYSLRCDLKEAQAFIKAHENDPEGLLVAVERESLRRDFAWLETLTHSAGYRDG